MAEVMFALVFMHWNLPLLLSREKRKSSADGASTNAGWLVCCFQAQLSLSKINFSPPRLALERPAAYTGNVTSVEIIEEIKRLPRAEQNRVIDFVRKAGEVRRLTPEELGELARKMAEAKDSGEADRLQTEIVRGFYGGQADA
jgi:hypothetical protein